MSGPNPSSPYQVLIQDSNGKPISGAGFTCSVTPIEFGETLDSSGDKELTFQGTSGSDGVATLFSFGDVFYGPWTILGAVAIQVKFTAIGYQDLNYSNSANPNNWPSSPETVQMAGLAGGSVGSSGGSVSGASKGLNPLGLDTTAITYIVVAIVVVVIIIIAFHYRTTIFKFAKSGVKAGAKFARGG